MGAQENERMNMDIGAAPEPAGFQPAQFAVSATESLHERRPRALKHADTFAVFDHKGDLLGDSRCADGLYHMDTRHLSRLELVLSGHRPMLLSSTLRDDNAMLTCDLTNPDLSQDGQVVLEHDLLHIRRSKFLWNAACHERLAIRNFATEAIRLVLEIRFDADFADLFEVRGMHREHRGTRHPVAVTADQAILSYTGLDGERRGTTLRFDPAPARMEANRAVYRIDLPPGGRFVLFMHSICDLGAAVPADRRPRDAFLVGLRDARRALRASASRATAIETSNEVFNEAVRRSVSDLYMLATETADGPYPYAGIPWFSTAFGRDALITALLTLWADPTIARGVLVLLAANQADRFDPASDAEPGKILHEVRRGEMAELGEVPFRRYYGSVDSTPLFVMLAGAYLERTGDLATLRALWPNVRAAVDWIDRFGDRDGDGFVEYFRQTDKGLANQGWKDSHDSVFHADGRAAQGPIALCEVQAYVAAARRAAASIARALDLADEAAALDAAATKLEAAFEAAFWSDELGTYALALDGDKRPCLVRTSNAGHALLAGVASTEHAGRVADQLLGSASFSGWGIRTLGTGEARYNPMSYHNGSVWPHDNALIGLGFARYGLRAAAARVLEGLFDAASYLDLRRLPELFCGFPRRRGQGPTFYPVACVPQAWSAAAPLGLLQACLGIGFRPASRTVTFDHPVLPRFLDEVILRGLRIADARIDVVLRRSDGGVAMTVLAREGEISAVVTS
jgi:glycogen debranching enzyme